MYGLESIRAINAHAAAKREDDIRRSKGQKPKGALGASIRKARIGLK